jgi:hypothetical protein
MASWSLSWHGMTKAVRCSVDDDASSEIMSHCASRSKVFSLCVVGTSDVFRSGILANMRMIVIMIGSRPRTSTSTGSMFLLVMAIAALIQWKNSSVTTILPITRVITVKVMYRFQVKGKKISRMSAIFQKHCGSKTDVKLCQPAFNRVQGFTVRLRTRLDVGDAVKAWSPLGVLLARLLLEYAASLFE